MTQHINAKQLLFLILIIFGVTALLISILPIHMYVKMFFAGVIATTSISIILMHKVFIKQ